LASAECTDFALAQFCPVTPGYGTKLNDAVRVSHVIVALEVLIQCLVVYVLAPAQAGEAIRLRSDPTCRYVLMSRPVDVVFVLTRVSSRGSALSEKKSLPRPSKTG
jgi:hypothetical protein